ASVEWQMRAHHDETLDADITFAAPPSVVALFRGALDAFRPAGAPLWKGCENVLEHVCGEWESQPRHRDPVFARDGWRCAVRAGRVVSRSGAMSFGPSGQRSAASARSWVRPTPTSNMPPM